MTEFAEPEVRVFDARRAAHDSKYIEGKDGWLFLDRDDNRVVEQHRGAVLLSEDQLRTWREALERRGAWAAARGGRYLFVIAPDAHAVYPEKLPPSIVPGEQRPVLQLLDELRRHEAGDLVLYPLDELHAAKCTQLVYAPTDTHWNAHGVFAVYDRIAADLGRSFPLRHVRRDEVRIIETVAAGDLGLKLQPERVSQQSYFGAVHRTTRRQWDNGVRGLGRTIAFACPEAPDTTCVLFGDSAAARLSTLLAETFGKFVLHYSASVDAEVAEREGADIVMSLLTERRLVNMPDDRGVPERV
jgi:alginate O-acetyltransferase complex protein AlgJ